MEKKQRIIKKIKSILDKFGKNKTPRIFRSEAQFQFELAWELNKVFGKKYKVHLEYLSAIATSNEKKQKKFFTDIILIDKHNRCGDYIAIELKYKTTENRKYNLSHHGAVNIGLFDYLWDLMRIQILQSGDCNPYSEIEIDDDLKNRKMIAGIAILLTNEKKYWETTQTKLQSASRNMPLYSDFCVGDGQSIEPNTTMSWYNKDKERGELFVKLNARHKCNWKEYCAIENGEFKYLVLEVHGKYLL